MGRREKERKGKAKWDYEEEEEEEGVEREEDNRIVVAPNPFSVSNNSDDDEEEANEDLSLKIVEKAMMLRACNSVVKGDENEDIVTTELAASSTIVKKKKKVKKEKKKKKKEKKVDENASTEIEAVTMTKEEEIVDNINTDVVKLPENGAVDNSNADNAVLRRLLRGPRYFDPPDKSWGACYNCGEQGHSAANCTSAKRKKPCFICGSLEHEAKQCQKDCYICNGGGHRAKDCPKKHKRSSQGSELCLKCGASAHTMSSCNNDYSPDDLKEIQCYVCKRFGHLCCENYLDALPSEASCYKCGHSGHNGQECRGSRGETSAPGTPSSCFKCGQEGHFARECKSTPKAKKRTRDLSTPKSNFPKEHKNKGFKSAPHDAAKAYKKKKLQFDDRSHDWSSPDWSSKSKRRGGWTMDDPEDYPRKKAWKSPATPNNKQHKIYGLTAGHSPSSQSYSKWWGHYSSGSGASSSQGYSRGAYHHHHHHHHHHQQQQQQQRYSASRFGNFSNDGMRKNYDWW